MIAHLVLIKTRKRLLSESLSLSICDFNVNKSFRQTFDWGQGYGVR